MPINIHISDEESGESANSIDDEHANAMTSSPITRRYTGYSSNKIITQYATRSHRVNPPVIYQASIFDVSTNRYSKPDSAVVTYLDDQPFQFATRAHNQTKQVDITQPDESTVKYDNGALAVEQEEEYAAEWTGPVFEVKLVGTAQFFENISRKRGLPTTKTIIPKTTEGLLLEKVSRQHIVLKSHHLLHALKGLVGYFPSFYTQLEEGYKQGFTIDEPFAVVMHHFQPIKELLEKEFAGSDQKNSRNFRLNELQKNHLRHLYEFAEPLYHANVVPCKQHLSEACPRIAFDMIWYLLKPGTDVYIQSEGVTFVGVVIDIADSFDEEDNIAMHTHENKNERKWWRVRIWYLNTDGATVRRTQKTCKINMYSGLRDVTELPIYPVSIWDAKDKGERRGKILARSRTFFKALQQGNLLAYHDGPVRDTNSYYTGKVVLDYRRGVAETDNSLESFSPVEDHCEHYKGYDQISINDYHEFKSSPSLRQLSAMEKDSIRLPRRISRSYIDLDHKSSNGKNRDIVQELTEHQLLLLHPETLVYGLKLKQWMITSVDYIQEIVPSLESISNLIIGEDELRTIRALSNKQNSKTKQWSADFIQGKGTGQIILLHGPPGVGKTYTVEAISEWLHRPLLALTVADIGTIETLVEQHLFKWFDLAEAWNAVLLVDEADIFLERRQNRDLGRNGLVSAFLRRMEYFKGLLFLTTNRVGQIDDAFISRVHVAIGYDRLNGETRKRIWNGFFQKLARERAGKIQVALDAKKWVLETTEESQVQLNGRDIRNALQTAITLAEFEIEEDPDYSPEMVIVVTKDHFQRVLEMNNKFHEYVTSIRREDERKRAQARGDRNDFDGDEAPSNQLSLLRRRNGPGIVQ